MNHELRIVETADGSNTIYNAEVGENYHSKHGALQESRHVFLNSGLQYFLDGKPAAVTNSQGTLSILEVGFGTGLNFLLTADLCIGRKINLDYTGIEAYPLNREMISRTAYDQYISAELWQTFIAVYEPSLQEQTDLLSWCKLQIANSKLLDFDSKKLYDIIYFDAFASANQPEMWNEAAISHTLQFLKPGGVFVTYAITGNLKRSLKALGCKVEKAPGAPGKREMLRAVKVL
jgi:tRNA U34 5-methylaminomethyl-2-thiouridine-forming methyltransferase MnmC